MGAKTLLTDLYQLTMNAAYFDNQKDEVATFDLFIRNLPEDWGYYIANGIEEAIDYATSIKFTDSDIDYLRNQGLFKEDFLEFLRNFRFDGEIYAVKEGTPVFPNEPIVRITASRTQAQFLESAILNIINFQTMIASKASRIVNAVGESKVVDFGLRRAQGEDAALKGARAAYIAGAIATSNVKAGKQYGIPVSGTMAHSFVMSFPTELKAFRAYAKTFPQDSTLLIDTYGTLAGARNAAIVAKELEARGNRLGAVRIDSGDLSDLSKRVRKILDERGLSYVKIFASNDLNEYKILRLGKQGAKIDGYGVGTEMITAKPVAAISGVYKLVEDEYGAKIKLSTGKETLPGRKQIFRQLDDHGKYLKDIIALGHERVTGCGILELAVKDGKRVRKKRTLAETREYCLREVAKLPGCVKAVRVSRHYAVEIAPQLNSLVDNLTAQYGGSGIQEFAGLQKQFCGGVLYGNKSCCDC